ncbi:hypothetical protein [Stenotrophomonas maltophilia]|uniref:hypothetical protein n=1 Tax=Stenotrophomonas maltophilia TaxID=40324 RepID=UPI0039C20729
MDLLTYISDMSRRAALAEACGTSPEYLWQIATGWRGKRPSPKLAFAIERESTRLGPATVLKEPMIFGHARQGAIKQIAKIVDSRMSKRALREKLGLSTDKQLAKVLKLPAEQIEAWAEEEQVPSIPQVLRLLGIEEPPPSLAPVIHDPDANRIGPVDTA